MKRTAFLQALVLVVLLAGTWLLLYLKWQGSPERPADSAPPARSAPPPAQAASAPAPPPEPKQAVPERWRDWWNYLERQPSPEAMRAALAALENLLMEMDPEEAAAWIRELLASGQDLRTGLAFQVGPGGSLRGAGTLQALLLDWLARIDPEGAGRLAQGALEQQGTSLVPDVFVVHLRNYALHHPQPETAFLQQHFADLLHEESWLESPGSAIAEAMDVAVYTRDTKAVPRLAELTRPDRPAGLRHAASLALERLVDAEPRSALDTLLRGSPAGTPPNLRASLFARLDPALPGAADLLETYLSDPSVDDREAHRFLEAFPNLNRSRSHNLLSAQNAATSGAGDLDRLRSALQQVREWSRSDRFPGLGEALPETARRIEEQLGRDPSP